MRNTLKSMGVTEEQLGQAQEQFRSQLEAMGGDASAIEMLFGGTAGEPARSEPGPLDDVSLEGLTIEDLPQPESGGANDETPEDESSAETEGDEER